VDPAPSVAFRVSQINTDLRLFNPKSPSLYSYSGLCPDGQLSGAKESRYALATVEERLQRIEALDVRLRKMEQLLERMHSLFEDGPSKTAEDSRNMATELGRSSTVPPEDVPMGDFSVTKVSKPGSSCWLGVSG